MISMHSKNYIMGSYFLVLPLTIYDNPHYKFRNKITIEDKFLDKRLQTDLRLFIKPVIPELTMLPTLR